MHRGSFGALPGFHLRPRLQKRRVLSPQAVVGCEPMLDRLSFLIELCVTQLFAQALREVGMCFAPCQRLSLRLLQLFVVCPVGEQRPHRHLLEHMLQEPGLNGGTDIIVAG